MAILLIQALSGEGATSYSGAGEGGGVGNGSYEPTPRGNETSPTHPDLSLPPDAHHTELLKYYVSAIVNPLLCACGLLGNILNIIVLTRRRMQSAMDCPMEKAAQLGLIALAVSDMLYCLSAIPDAYISQSQTVFHGRTFWLYVQMYGPYLQNVFFNTSTWLTVLMATGRYAAICRPLHARYLVEVNGTRVAVAIVFLIWIILELPILWEYSLVEMHCPPDETSFFILDRGFFVIHLNVKTVFMYIWSIFGYFIPVIILIYCNAHLIKALKASYRMRKLYRVHSKAADPGTHITPTLIAIVCAFLLLVSPSEIIHFYYYMIDRSQVEDFSMAIVVTNVLQTLNFSLNFLLYCVVNAHFRDTWHGMMYCIWRGRGELQPSHRASGRGYAPPGALSTATTTTTLSNGKSAMLLSSTDLDQIQLKYSPNASASRLHASNNRLSA
jgi:hypothetical protein